MTSRHALMVAAALLTSSSAFAQGLSADVGADRPTTTRVEAPIAGTAVPLQSGRSVRRDRSVSGDTMSNGPSLDTPSICTNCDD